MAGAEAIATKFARHKQQRYGGHINITKTFAISIFRRMGFVKRKGTKGVKHLPADWLHQRRVRQQSQQRYQRTQHSRLISNQLGPDRVSTCTRWRLDHGTTGFSTSVNYQIRRQTPDHTTPTKKKVTDSGSTNKSRKKHGDGSWVLCKTASGDNTFEDFKNSWTFSTLFMKDMDIVIQRLRWEPTVG